MYEVQGTANSVAKIYREAPAPAKAAKLAAMAQGATPELLKIGAWPTSVLYTGNRAVGLLMPKVVGHHEIHQLYGTKQRRIEFPTADWGFLVHAARNVAAAFETIHAHGHVVGDVNQGNIVVSQKTTVMLIDCDSFQIAINGTRHLCEVGVAHFTPPELHGRSFNGVVRTPNHDAFGLAVTLFHLLFLGKHPFAGRYQGHGDMPIEKAIVEHRFAYSQQAAARQMLPPPHTISLAHVSFGLASLFERAFAPGSERGGRPTALQWRSALEAYRRELRRCTACPTHSFHQSLPRCPLCDIERAVGTDFFLVITGPIGAVGTAFDIEALWRKVQAVPAPETAGTLTPALPKVQPRPLPQSLRAARIAAWLALAGVGASGVAAMSLSSAFIWPALGLILLWLMINSASGLKTERAKRKAQLDSATRQIDNLIERTKRDLDDVSTRFVASRGALKGACDEYRQLPAGEHKALQDLLRQREATQKQRFLERFFIAHAQIQGIGPGLTATLASYGIEAADDVTWSVGQIVPGFGPSRTSDLMAWRASIEARFRFDASKGVDPADQQAVKNRFARRRQELERVLGTGLSDLQRFREQSRRQRQHASQHLASGAVALAQAKADAEVI